MSFVDWVRESVGKITTRGLSGVWDVLYDLYIHLWWLAWPVPRGTNVYDRDWDLLIILDACRIDLLESVADEYEFIEDIERMESVGSMSKEWMAKTFTDEYADETSQTAYVTANVFSEQMLDADQFHTLAEVWRDGWDTAAGTVRPRQLTDRTIQLARNEDPDRLIVHYVQPHHPFLDLDDRFDGAAFGPDRSDTVVDALRKGKIDRDTYWQAYQDNLRRALDDVEVLLANIDADRVAITADHGDALGEWGIYDHPVGCLHPAVKDVPWVETTASDTGEYIPDEETTQTDTSVEDRLQSLGYLD